MLRRCIAELLGTFAIVFFGCGAIATLAGSPTAHLAVNAVFGLTVASCIYALGHISSAHFNPAVTFAFAVVGRFPWRSVPYYVMAQVLGAVIACGLQALLFGDLAAAAHYGATAFSVDVWRCVGIEAVLSFLLMLVIVSVATDSRVHGAMPGLAIGMTVALCGLFGGPLTGCSMNPARSFAPALFSGSLGSFWPYLVGPVLGASLAALVYEAIRGSNPEEVPGR